MKKLSVLAQPEESPNKWSARHKWASCRQLCAGLLTGVFLASLTACGSTAASPVSSKGPIQVVSSIGQWSSLVSQLGGDRVTTQAIINNPNTDAHDYEPTTADIATLSRARLVVINGAAYDSWAQKAAQSNESRLVNVAELSGHVEGDNPHLWFSSGARKAAAQAINSALEELNPADKAYFAQQYQAWLKQERDLDQHIRQASATTEGLTYGATESVAHYLAQDLGMRDQTPVGYLRAAANESEPSPADITSFEAALASHQLNALVFNSQEATEISQQLVQAAKAAKLPVVEVSEQMPARYKTLEEWIRALVSSFDSALS